MPQILTKVQYKSTSLIDGHIKHLPLKLMQASQRQMQSLGERELPNMKKKGAGVKHTEGLYFLMDMDVRYVLCLI